MISALLHENGMLQRVDYRSVIELGWQNGCIQYWPSGVHNGIWKPIADPSIVSKPLRVWFYHWL